MPRIVISLVTAGLLLLTACSSRTPQEAAVDKNAAMMEDAIERAADNLESMAGNTADANASDAIRNAADNLEDLKGNIADDAQAQKDNLTQ